MALFTVDSKGNERTWHVGDQNPGRLIHHEDVVLVQADGDELVAIHQQIRNIPTSSPLCRVVCWHGDYAKFIAANLQLKQKVI